MQSKRYSWFCVFALLMSAPGYAETFYEVSAGVSQLALDIVRKRGEDFADDTSALNISVGAYRNASEKSAWGAVIEYSLPVGRDDLPGSGRIVGFRPVNYLRYIGSDTSVELYAGFAQYEWRKTANGYYFGTTVRYEFYENRLGIGLDAKYYQDLAFDSPEGDDIVDGFNTGLRLFYRFK